jgi:hypothetical protein
MAIKSLNSVGGFSVLDNTGNTTVVIDSTSNFNAANLTVSGNSILGSNTSVSITGGSAGQFLKTDGTGNLSWSSAGGGAGTLYIIERTGTVGIPVTGGTLVVAARSGNVNVIVS